MRLSSTWVPDSVDPGQPSVARIYDYYLGGSHNFAVDRRFAEQAIAEWPDLPVIMAENRAFLRRAVRFLVDAGIRQFIDLGSGIPTAGNVHEVAQAASADTRVVYADIDPVAVAHSRAILAGNHQTAVIQADLRHPDQVLTDPVLTAAVDLTQPVAVLMVAVLHFVLDRDDPAGIVAGIRERIAPGSYVVVSHASPPGGSSEVAAAHQARYTRGKMPMVMRGPEQIRAILDGFELIDPGLVRLPEWRPEPGREPSAELDRIPGHAAVARRTGGG